MSATIAPRSRSSDTSRAEGSAVTGERGGGIDEADSDGDGDVALSPPRPSLHSRLMSSSRSSSSSHSSCPHSSSTPSWEVSRTRRPSPSPSLSPVPPPSLSPSGEKEVDRHRAGDTSGGRDCGVRGMSPDPVRNGDSDGDPTGLSRLSDRRECGGGGGDEGCGGGGGGGGAAVPPPRALRLPLPPIVGSGGRGGGKVEEAKSATPTGR